LKIIIKLLQHISAGIGHSHGQKNIKILEMLISKFGSITGIISYFHNGSRIS